MEYDRTTVDTLLRRAIDRGFDPSRVARAIGQRFSDVREGGLPAWIEERPSATQPVGAPGRATAQHRGGGQAAR